MNTIEINAYLRRYKNFRGTFPRDWLPGNLPAHSGVVINTDKACDPGEHWVAVYMNKDKAEYFDSFGLPPMHEEIIQFLDKISPDGWQHNSITYQSLYTDTCGNYSVYFLASRFNGDDDSAFRKIFSFNPKMNDRLAKYLYNIRKI
jgi:hypothetical protein